MEKSRAQYPTMLGRLHEYNHALVHGIGHHNVHYPGDGVASPGSRSFVVEKGHTDRNGNEYGVDGGDGGGRECCRLSPYGWSGGIGGSELLDGRGVISRGGLLGPVAI
ncbi:hypothetical protein FE257_003126 [Aspergillus nanangensis]|uniref:Uncharacterized protein n=1 Tax=Aspergillus nanangensis TaxID=2582783 RepID=A0AAD4GMZ5_ASPNN|nr:hypothetical protein FE257_003126 [Aspergillus nanangensis]